MYDLFNPIPDNVLSKNDLSNSKIINDISMIQGLTYIPNFIDNLEVNQFIESIKVTDSSLYCTVSLILFGSFIQLHINNFICKLQVYR